MDVFPSSKVTVPVADVLVLATFAVKVTELPKLIVAADVVRVVVVVGSTVCVRLFEALAEKFESPPYAALMVCAPSARLLVEKVATPLPLSVAWPIDALPSSKVTFPVASALLLVTVAVNVIVAPKAVVALGVSVRLVVVVD